MKLKTHQLSSEELLNLAVVAQKAYNKDGVFPKKEMEKLYNAIYPFITKFASSKSKKIGYQCFDDLTQISYEALCSAVRKFDATKTDNFFFYVCKWISAYVKAEQTRQLSVFRFGSRLDRKIFSKIANVSHLTLEEQAVALGVSRQHLDEFIQATKTSKSLFKKTSEDSDIESEEYLKTSLPDPEALLNVKELYIKIKEVFDDFTSSLKDEREKAVFDLLTRVGSPEKGNFKETDLDDKLPQTYADIAQLYGVSRERVRQIACSIKDKLRRKFEKNGIDEKAYHAFI